MTTRMRASAREMRHMVGRYLHAQSLPGFAVNAVRDAIMAAEAEGFDAVTEMERLSGAYADARTSFAVAHTEAGVVLDGHATAALVLLPALVDELALAAARGETRVEVVATPGIRIAAALGDYAAVRGVAFEVELPQGADSDSGDRAILTPRAVPSLPVHPAEGAAGERMRRILLEGYELDAEQFWRLFRESNAALTPDSELSRRHAGSQLYDDEGNLLGEVSEETYLHLRREAQGTERAVLA